MTNCPAAHGTYTCRRLDHVSDLLGWRRPHPMPHLAHDGTQWDEHGIRQARGNDPYRSER